jgi:hypothetical protein
VRTEETLGLYNKVTARYLFPVLSPVAAPVS